MTSPATKGMSRVFTIEGRARPDHDPNYEGCMRAGGLEEDYGEDTDIECPSGAQYKAFDVVGSYSAGGGRPGTSLTSLYQVDALSKLMRLGRAGCAFDLQIHFGLCQNPDDFDDFSKAVIIEAAKASNYSTGDIGAMTKEEVDKIEDTSNITGRVMYEVLPLTMSETADSVVTNELLDTIIADNPSCGECETLSTGCDRMYAISLAAGGSPATPADVVYTLNRGRTWASSEIDSLGVGEDPTAIARIARYLVVVSADSCSLHYVLQNDLDAAGDETWVEQATGFVNIGAGTCPMDMWSVGGYAFIAAGSGYVYGCSNPTAGVTVLDAGNTVHETLRAVHALDRNTAVCVGSAGAVIYTYNGGITWAAATRPVGAGVDLYCVWVKSRTEWFVGSSDGRLLCTFDGGVTWHDCAFPNYNTGIIWDIQMPSASVMYVSHETATDEGRILRSFNGGKSFIISPMALGATIPNNDRIRALASCPHDVNLIYGVGLDDGAVDGIVVIGAVPETT